MKSPFGSKELVACLLCLGFTKEKSTGSSHIKYRSPKKVQKGMHPFITVILQRKVYDPHTQSCYLRDIRVLGFTNIEIRCCMP